MDRNETAQREQRNDQRRQKVIGLGLRQLYADIADEPTPEAFLRLLEQVDRLRAA